ncbi:hypothetical protein [Phosphitispora sp. TUW77]|uniref:hypothetical protein n=1 Tax=Phosphitispora sp. TUW77 TaxID=3152361 RepID=UPI003AB5A71F
MVGCLVSYRGLYFLGIILLSYSVIMVLCKFDFSRKTRIHIKRIYYSLYVICAAFLLTNLDNARIQTLGVNKLGLAPELWFIIVLFLIAFIIDLLVVSAVEFKEINFFGNKMMPQIEDMSDQLSEQVSLTDELEKKIRAMYKLYQDLKHFTQPIRDKIDNSEAVDIIEEFEKFLKYYFDAQEDWAIEVKIFEEGEIDESNEFGIIGNEFQKCRRQLVAMKSYLYIKGIASYMFIPYESALLDYNKILVVIYSKEKVLIGVEQFLIIVLLQQFEEQILI